MSLLHHYASATPRLLWNKQACEGGPCKHVLSTSTRVAQRHLWLSTKALCCCCCVCVPACLPACLQSPALNNTLTTLLYSIGQSATSHGGDHPEATTSTHARREAASTGGDSSAKLLSAEGGMSSSHAEPVGQQQAGGTDSASTSTGRRSRSHRVSTSVKMAWSFVTYWVWMECSAP